MSEENLRKWNLVCVIVIMVSALVEIIAITALTYSAYNNTILSEAPDIIIKALAYIPWITFWVSALLRFYFISKLKKTEAQKTEDRINELERQIEQLKRK